MIQTSDQVKDYVLESPTGSGKSAYPAGMPRFGPTPASCDLPFPDWRDGQHETLSWLHEQIGGGSVITLCQAKALQDAYGETFDFDVLKGKGNREYPCVHPRALPSATAGDCKHSKNMYNCAQVENCRYVAQKALCKKSKKTCLNYSLYFALKGHWPEPHALFLDEAQQLPRIVLNHAGLTFNQQDWMFWNQYAGKEKLPFLPPLPSIRGGNAKVVGQTVPVDQARDWLIVVRDAMRLYWARLDAKAISKDDLRKKRACEYKGRSLSATIEALIAHAGDWWIRSSREGFVCKPLTAKHHAPGYLKFGEASRVFMSATIGDMEVFAARLGIPRYQGRVIDNAWPAESRPILDLDCPPMGAASVRKNPRYADMQADNIAGLLSKYPDDLGLIHVSSKRKAWNLREKLARKLNGRVWVTPEVGTSEMMTAWERESARRENLVTVTWAWWEGVDLGQVGVNVVASVPWAYLGDPYERAKMEHDRAGFDQDAAWKVEQAKGRNRRGDESHYKVNGNRGNIVAIADGNWRRLEKYYSRSFLESVV